MNESTNSQPKKADWLRRQDNANRTAPGIEGYPGEKRVPSERERRREEVLTDWLGTERFHQVVSDFRPDFDKISDLVDLAIQEKCDGALVLLFQIRRVWPKIADQAAQASYPSHLNGKKLVVEITNPSWQYAIRANVSAYERQLKEKFPGKIESIQLVQKGRFRR